MDADAFKQVTTAIQGRIAAATGTTVHVGPLDDTEATGSSGLVLFLYRVAVNPDLRNTGHRPPPKQTEPRPTAAGAPPSPSSEADIAEIFESALPFDLFYLLSASPSPAGDDLEGLGQLGQAIQVLNDQPFFMGSLLRGELVRVSIDTVSTEELSRIWALFPTVNYRTSVIFFASPVWIDPKAPAMPGIPVVSQGYDALAISV